MAKKSETTSTNSISEVIKASQTEETEGEDMAKATTWGSFKIETGTIPERSRDGTRKYDWASFPAPSNPDDPKTWPSAFIPGLSSGKTIYTSIKKFREKLQEGGAKTVPEFTVSVSKDPKGVRVIRKS